MDGGSGEVCVGGLGGEVCVCVGGGGCDAVALA